MRPEEFSSQSVINSDHGPPLDQFGRRFLAEGDSWFTIGSLPVWGSSNLLKELDFRASTAIVNCAYPGDTLRQVVGSVNDPYFDRLLRHRRLSRYWEAIVLSAGGNDLFDAAGHGPTYPDGTVAALQDRLLLTPAEATAENPTLVGAERYISDPGWARFETYLKANLAELAQRRELGPSAGRPIFLHTYVPPTVRAPDATGSSKAWVARAVLRYGIPAAEHQALMEALFVRLRDALRSVDADSGSPSALAAVHVFDVTASVVLDPADPGTTDDSGDWLNEIHPNRKGYRKIGLAMGAWIDALLAARYP